MFTKKLLPVFALFIVLLTAVLLVGCGSKAPPVNTNFGGLNITLKDVNGQLVGGAKLISATLPDGQAAVTAISDASGVLAVRDVKVGQYHFTITKTDYQSLELNINVVGGQNSSIELQMMPGTLKVANP